MTTNQGDVVGIPQRINGTPPPCAALGDIDLSSMSFWSQDDAARDGAFLTLRREAPIRWQREPKAPGLAPGKGYWALTRYADVRYVSRHPELFSSYPSSTTIGDPLPRFAEYSRSMIAMDDPEHARLRGLVSRAFSPKVVANIDNSIRRCARNLVRTITTEHPQARCDFISQFAAPLPMHIICEMMGVPAEDRHDVLHWSNVITGSHDPEWWNGANHYLRTMKAFADYGVALARERKKRPRADLTTRLVQTQKDGHRLTPKEISAFFILLVAAGNETTRNAIAHGMVALSRYPDQRCKWWSDFEGLAPTAVEEILRWATPINFMRRTLTSTVVISGTKLEAGDKVTMWYNSANRDETSFANPWYFDITRSPNPHLAFGGGGTHFCLGANLARREIRLAFQELHRQIPTITAVGEPTLLRSPFVQGITHLPVGWTVRKQ